MNKWNEKYRMKNYFQDFSKTLVPEIIHKKI